MKERRIILKIAAMKLEDDQEELVLFTIALDDVTVARLMEIADNAHADPRKVAAAIVKDVLEDDARQHSDGPFDSSPSYTLN